MVSGDRFDERCRQSRRPALGATRRARARLGRRRRAWCGSRGCRPLPCELATTIAFLARGEADFITGAVLNADGGRTAV
jgi:NAD(P)-dependent dehydrogenase (short-subunit alcohol dehydrogenase family)